MKVKDKRSERNVGVNDVNMGDFDDKFGVSNENLGFTKIFLSEIPKQNRSSNENLGISNAKLRVSSENVRPPMKIWGLRWISRVSNINVGGLQIKFCKSFNENLGISNENLGSPMKICGSLNKNLGPPMKIWGSPNENLEVFVEKLRVNMGIYNEIALGLSLLSTTMM